MQNTVIVSVMWPVHSYLVCIVIQGKGAGPQSECVCRAPGAQLWWAECLSLEGLSWFLVKVTLTLFHSQVVVVKSKVVVARAGLHGICVSEKDWCRGCL